MTIKKIELGKYYKCENGQIYYAYAYHPSDYDIKWIICFLYASSQIVNNGTGLMITQSLPIREDNLLSTEHCESDGYKFSCEYFLTPEEKMAQELLKSKKVILSAFKNSYEEINNAT